jgi:hypothetical protein
MPNIPPLVTTMPDNQSLYASYVQDTPADAVLQNYSSVPLPCTGSGILTGGTTSLLFTKVVPYNFGTNSWQPFVFCDAGFSYTATGTGSISFTLALDGAPLQTINQTLSGGSQLVQFAPQPIMLPARTGAGTFVVSVSVLASVNSTLATTNSVSLYGAVIGCKI